MEIKKQMLEFDKKKGIASVLLALYKNEELRVTELLGMISISRDTFYRRTGNWMEVNGLIKSVPNMDNKIFVLQITEKGRKIAEHLLEIEKLF